MQNNKRLNFKLEGAPFNLEFPEVTSTTQSSSSRLTESIFKKKLNREDFKAKLISERSFRVYYKKTAIGTPAEASYCALVRTKNGIPAQFALVLVKGNKKHVEYTADGPVGKILYASPSFNQFWEYLITTISGLPENYATSCILLDSRIPQGQKNIQFDVSSTAQPASAKPAASTQAVAAKPVTTTSKQTTPSQSETKPTTTPSKPAQ